MSQVRKSSYCISPYLYIIFYGYLKIKFKDEWVNAGFRVPKTDPAIWDLDEEEGDEKVFRRIFGKNVEYFYRAHLTAIDLIIDDRKQENIENKFLAIKYKAFNKALVYLECDGVNHKERLASFYTKFNISNDIINLQKELTGELVNSINLVFTKESTKEIEEYSNEEAYVPEVIESYDSFNNESDEIYVKDISLEMGISALPLKFKGIQAKAYHYLKDSSWWLYYTTDNAFSNYFREGYWPLFKAILNFEDFDQSLNKMKINIENNFDTDTVNYVGEIDFENSGLEVLVMNLNHVVSQGGQLNIKVNIGKGDGDLFLGQFLNFNEAGSIFSGTLVMNKFIRDLTKPKPKPERHFIKTNSIFKDWPDDVKFLMNFFIKEDQNFRRIPSDIHSKVKFINTFK